MLTVEIINKIEHELRYGEVLKQPIASMESILLNENSFELVWYNPNFPTQDEVPKAIVNALYPDHPIKGMDLDWSIEGSATRVTISFEY